MSKFLKIIVIVCIFINIAIAVDDLEVNSKKTKKPTVNMREQGLSCDEMRKIAQTTFYFSPGNMNYFREKCGPKKPYNVVNVKPSDSKIKG